MVVEARWYFQTKKTGFSKIVELYLNFFLEILHLNFFQEILHYLISIIKLQKQIVLKTQFYINHSSHLNELNQFWTENELNEFSCDQYL